MRATEKELQKQGTKDGSCCRRCCRRPSLFRDTSKMCSDPERERSLEEMLEVIREKDKTISDLKKQVEINEQKISQLIEQVKLLKSEIPFSTADLEIGDDLSRSGRGKKLANDFSSASSVPVDSETGSVSWSRKIQLRNMKRQAVSAESAEFHSLTAADRRKIMTKIGKAAATKEILNRAIQENEFLQRLDAFQVREMVDRMQPSEFSEGSLIIKEGDQGSHVFAIEVGSVEISKEGLVVAVMGPGKIFGEVAILYNCKRTASAKALELCKLWTIERKVFQAIMMAVALRKREEYTNFLLSVPIINTLSRSTIFKIVDALEEVRFEHGEYIIRQDQPGNTFYIISRGSVKVTKNQQNSSESLFICMLHKGQFFGELALETEEKRSANIIAWSEDGVTCLVLERKAYKQLIGKSGYLRPTTLETETQPVESQRRSETDELSDVTIEDLNIVTTIGMGGFGRVEMATLEHDGKVLRLALKKMAKSHIVQTCQQEHVMNEKDILKDIKSNFIIRLYKTFKDAKYLYLLMELGEGGELWMLLRDRVSFDSNSTRFYCACVIEALEFLHKRGIVYRDIKPENLVLNERGYAKLVDFGFAKRLGAGQKTFTFCGTPEYLSPEVILNKGHDQAVDIWSLGIFIYELQTGSPPFNETDHMKTYRSILRGIESVEFPKFFNKFSQQLVKQLCRENPNDRLGYNSQGMKIIRKHTWFDGFNWDGLRNMTIEAPFHGTLTTESEFAALEEKDFEALDDESGWDVDF